MKYVLSEGVVLRQKSPSDPFYEINRGDGSGWKPYSVPSSVRDWYEGTVISEAKAKEIIKQNAETPE